MPKDDFAEIQRQLEATASELKTATDPTAQTNTAPRNESIGRRSRANQQPTAENEKYPAIRLAWRGFAR
jgi:hypothetical protein